MSGRMTDESKDPILYSVSYLYTLVHVDDDSSLPDSS